MAAAQPAAAVDELAPWPLGRRAFLPVTLAAGGARSRLGAAEARFAGPQGPPLAARHCRLRPPAGEGDCRHAAPALGAPDIAARAAPARRRRALARAGGCFFVLLRRGPADGGVRPPLLL